MPNHLFPSRHGSQHLRLTYELAPPWLVKLPSLRVPAAKLASSPTQPALLSFFAPSQALNTTSAADGAVLRSIQSFTRIPFLYTQSLFATAIPTSYPFIPLSVASAPRRRIYSQPIATNKYTIADIGQLHHHMRLPLQIRNRVLSRVSGSLGSSSTAHPSQHGSQKG